MDTLQVSMVGNQKFKQLIQESCSSRGGLVKYDNIPNSPSFHHVLTDIFIHYKASGKADWEVKRIKKIFKGYTVLNVILHSILVLHFIQIQEQSWWAE